MLNAVYCEFLKLKGLRIPLMILICITIPIIIGHSISYYDNLIVLNTYFQTIVWTNWVVFIVLFSLIIDMIFANEYKNNTIKNMFSYPMLRRKLFGAKIITLTCIIAIVYMLSLVVSLISVIIVKHKPFSVEFLFHVLGAYITSVIGFICFVSLIVAVCILTKRIIEPLIFSMFSVICIIYFYVFSSQSGNFKWIYFWPATSPLQLSLEILGEEKIPMEMIYLACTVLAISLIAGCAFSIYIFNKREVK